VLRDLKERDLKVGPLPAVGDEALGFWGMLEQIYPSTAGDVGNVLASVVNAKTLSP
jgi:hypothetical protein